MLGRRSDNDVVVDENWVSRQHALIIETSTGFALRDLNTTNGTFVNGGRIGPAEHLLNHGDSIRLAGSQVSFIFREEGGGLLNAWRWTRPPRERWTLRGSSPSRRPLSLRQRTRSCSGIWNIRDKRQPAEREIARSVWPEIPSSALANQQMDKAVERLRLHLGDDPHSPTRLITVGEFGFLLL